MTRKSEVERIAEMMALKCNHEGLLINWISEEHEVSYKELAEHLVDSGVRSKDGFEIHREAIIRCPDPPMHDIIRAIDYKERE